MQSFSPPNHRLNLSRMTIESMLKEDKIFNYFPIHSIHLLVPGEAELIQSCTEKLMSSENVYFIVEQITASTLIQNTFVTHFLKAGSLWALSKGEKEEVPTNSLSVIPSGKLILSLEKEIASSLSLAKERPASQKRSVKSTRKGNQTYIIDMSSPDFSPGKKLYKSISFELEKLNHIKFDLLLKWEPEGNVCPESIRDYFESLGFECSTYEPNHYHCPKVGVPTPEINFQEFDSSAVEVVLEWVGAHVCDIDLSEDVDSFVSNFSLPQPSQTFRRLQVDLYNGFYSGTQVHSLLKEVRNLFENHPNVPFVVVSMCGYQDCYVSCKGLEDFTSADKMICLVIPPDFNSWVITLNII